MEKTERNTQKGNEMKRESKIGNGIDKSKKKERKEIKEREKRSER